MGARFSLRLQLKWVYRRLKLLKSTRHAMTDSAMNFGRIVSRISRGLAIEFLDRRQKPSPYTEAIAYCLAMRWPMVALAWK
jgi:hypothetical protein